MAPSIESIVLRYDRRGIGRLQGAIGADFCAAAAEMLLASDGPVLIATGFYIAHAKKPETDGPPGAIALARALRTMGRDAALVTDAVCAHVLAGAAPDVPLHVLAMGSGEAVRAQARAVRAAARPGLLVAVERCGPDADDRFLQFDGTDISAFTGRLDYLFDGTLPSLGVVDGGNEIGIGGVAAAVRALPGLPKSPCVVPTDRIVLGSVSNWGVYGLLAAASRKAGRVLLPTVAEEQAIREAVVAAGAIDGSSGESIGAVDGYPSELNGLVVARLHAAIAG